MNADMLLCPQCGTEVPTSALLCPTCNRPNISTAFAGTYSANASPAAESGVVQPGSFSYAEELGGNSHFTYSSTEASHTDNWTEHEQQAAKNSEPPRTVPGYQAAASRPNMAEPPPLSPLLAPTPTPQRDASDPTLGVEAPDKALGSAPLPLEAARKLRNGEHPLMIPNGPTGAPPLLRQQWQAPPTTPSLDHTNTWTSGSEASSTSKSSGQRSNIAFSMELLGVVGFLGLGHIYGGRRARGMTIMIGWWVYSVMMLVWYGSTRFPPLPCLCMVHLLAPVLSAVWTKYDVEQGGLKRNKR